MYKSKGMWKVSSNSINGKIMYIAYRLLDIYEVDHSGNREYMGEYENNKIIVEKLVAELNGKEEKE